MTTTSDYITDSQGRNPAVDGVSVRALDTGRTLGRLARRVTGAGLILAAAGLWLAPGSSWAADILLIKLVLSLVAGASGWRWSRPGPPLTHPRSRLTWSGVVSGCSPARGDAMLSCMIAALPILAAWRKLPTR